MSTQSDTLPVAVAVVEKDALSPATADRLNRGTLKEQIVHLLRRTIASGKMSPGQRINESGLARDLGVSRIPVREALQQLEEQGLVVNYRRRGMFVVSLDQEQIQKINSLRIVLEAEALRLCRAYITSEGATTLLQMVEKMDRANGLQELEAADLDLEFHRVIWKYSGNDLLEKILNGLVVPLFAHRAVWRANRNNRGWGSLLFNHHLLLIDFIRGNCSKSAEEVMLEHLSFRFDSPAEFSSMGIKRTETPSPLVSK